MRDQDLKFYFCGSIRGGRQLAADYRRIIEMMKQYGEVLTEHLGDDREIETKDRILSDVEIHDRDMNWVKESDLVIAEVTIPSLGVGYEIGRAVELGIPVLSLFKSGSGYYLSAMISGSEGLTMCHYEDIEELKDPIKRFIAEGAHRRTS